MNDIEKYMSDENILKMKNYIQHGNTSTYTHCRDVANNSLKIARALRIDVDQQSIIKGAILHDFYLYDWHQYDNGEHRLHGYTHADTALKNAKKYFNIDKSVEHIIWCHMWPLNITRIPKTKEAWIVCLADKYTSVIETLKKQP